MTLALRGGRVVLPDGQVREVDVICENGLIVTVGVDNDARADEVIDCRGAYVLPGVIDPHVHTRDPGATHKEDLEHAAAAAVAGGTTTMFEMPNTVPPAIDPDVLRARQADHQAQAVVNIRLWTLVLGGESAQDLVERVAAGAIAGKLFWGYAFDRATGALAYDPSVVPPDRLIEPATTGQVRGLFRAAHEAGLLLGIHCEDRSVLEDASRPIDDYEDLVASRPVEAEAISIAAAIELAAAMQTRIHILHISSARSVELVRRAKLDGIPVTAETCPHYLSLTARDYATAGSALKIFPPVRAESDRRALLAAVEDGTVDSIGSDHAPHSETERSGPLAAQPAGAAAIETLTSVVLDLVASGDLSLGAAVRGLSARTAEVYGLGERKGRVEAGFDADLTVVDLDSRWDVDARRLHTKAKVSPWDGRRLRGRPTATIVAGRPVMLDGELMA